MQSSDQDGYMCIPDSRCPLPAPDEKRTDSLTTARPSLNKRSQNRIQPVVVNWATHGYPYSVYPELLQSL